MRKLLLIIVFVALLPLGYVAKEMAFAAGESTGTNTATAIATACKGNNCNTVTATHTATYTIPTVHDTTTVTNTSGTTTTSLPTGTIFCLGDPAYGYQGNYTSNGWGRQFPLGHPERVDFDNSVNVMQSAGCSTVRAELQAGDKDTQGGTSNLRAQTYKDPNQALYDAMGTNPGQTTWYGFAFSTNPGYVPQSDSPYPSWNTIFTWHGTLDGGGNPLAMEVSSKGWTGTVLSDGTSVQLTNSSGYTDWPDGKTHLALEVDGGDPAKYPTSGATAIRMAGPVFVPGHLYRVEQKITWSDNYAGAVEWWVDGVKYGDISGICNMQLGGRVWALFENYRPYSASFPTTDVYYGGLIKGSSRAEVMVP